MKYRIIGGIVVFLIAGAIWKYRHPASLPQASTSVIVRKAQDSTDRSSPPAAMSRTDSATPPLSPTAPPSIPRTSTQRDFKNPLEPSTIPGVAEVLPTATDAAMESDFDKIYLMLRDYRTITGENPVGTNSEIMKSIMGGNPKGAMLGPPEGQSVNGEGELIDRWGTPFFFHQLTKDLMEIRSAGPDRKMWTADDSVSK